MTATLTTPTIHYTTVRVPATFPIETRPVYVTPVADMTAKAKAVGYPQMSTAIRGLLHHHPDDRVLIHTVSYDLAAFLLRDLLANLGPTRKRLLTYSTARDRDATIARYRQVEGSVLIAPSLERGVDFAHDDCRVVAVAKIPFPNLGDKQVSARMHSRGGNAWYAVQTVRSLVQMCGRGTRAADDFSSTYILDRLFVTNVWKRSQHLIPGWFTESLDWSASHVRLFNRLAAQQGRKDCA